MTLLHIDAPAPLGLLAWLLAAVGVLHALRRMPRPFLPTAAAQHGWLAAIVCLSLLWSLRVRSPVGLDFGLLGSALFTLIFGRVQAILGLLAALAIHTVLGSGSWASFGLDAVTSILVPVWITAALQVQLERRMPKNLFVFIIGNGLFVTLLATACSALMMLALAALEAPARTQLIGDLVAYALLLAWGEALLSGMLFSALVVFLPVSVLTYRQDLYLPPRKRLL